jgi:pimeloyl-ACP methyl ester carboxylesterase
VLTTAFDNWARDWLADDHRAADRVASSVRVPSGPAADIADAWSGRLAYDPSGVRAPTLIIRGEWDSRTTDDDVRWLFDALVAAPLRREVKLRGGTHLMHLEVGRHALYRETTAFLLGGDHPAP